MVRRVGIAGLVLATAAVLAPGHAASLPSGAGCSVSGTAKFTPGLTTKSASTSYTLTGTLGPCRSTDATIKTGTLSALGHGTMSCVNGSTTGSGTIRWSNGKTSSLVLSLGKSVGPLMVFQGHVTAGEFQATGNTAGFEFVIALTGVAACKGAPGVTSSAFKGEIGVGIA